MEEVASCSRGGSMKDISESEHSLDGESVADIVETSVIVVAVSQILQQLLAGVILSV